VVILIFLPQGVGGAIRDQWRARRAARESSRVSDEPKQEATRDAPVTAAIGYRGSPDSPVASASAVSILRVDTITMSFGGLVALAHVSFDLPQGAVTALIGPNGSGKTTMINIISGIYRPRQGTIAFGDRTIAGLRAYRISKMGLTRTFQNVQVFDTMTVLENVMVGMHAGTRSEFCASMLHLPSVIREERKIEQKAWETLAFFNLEDRAHWPASSLSFGQQKRLEMARALVCDPKLILLDEPVAGLNMSESLEMARLITRLRSRGISILLVEHDMNLVMGISNKVVVLNYGRKIAEGCPHDVQRNEEVLSAYLGRVA
jgi:ABC-type branched-subunit amino acid transport system ATPase component